MIRNYFLLTILSSIVLLPNDAIACKKKKAKKAVTEAAQAVADAAKGATTPTTEGTSVIITETTKEITGKDVAINRTDFSTATKPNVDFFDYVNENWIKENPIPADKAAYGMFDKLD